MKPIKITADNANAIEAVTLHPNQGGKHTLTLTRDQAAEAHEAFAKQFTVAA